MNIEQTVIDVIEGRKKSPALSTLLRLASHGYRAGVSLRNFGYDQKILPSHKLPLPTVSIGNIVAGGTGKTPITQYIAEALMAQAHVAILSRGYRRKGRGSALVHPKASAHEVGDEPLLLAQKLPKCSVFVGKDRLGSAMHARAIGAQILLLDDGMQHRKIERDFEIGVLQADDLFGQGHYLPRGFLRDHPRRLRHADLLIVTGVKSQKHFKEVQKKLAPITSAPVTAFSLVIENSAAITSKKVGAFCAIASPHRFFSTLKSLGCEVVAQEIKADHRSFSIKEIEQLAGKSQAQGATHLICTEKDLVKLPQKLSLSIPLQPLTISLKPSYGKEHFEQLLQQIKEAIV